jgi:hypothetical protein
MAVSGAEPRIVGPTIQAHIATRKAAMMEVGLFFFGSFSTWSDRRHRPDHSTASKTNVFSTAGGSKACTLKHDSHVQMKRDRS